MRLYRENLALKAQLHALYIGRACDLFSRRRGHEDNAGRNRILSLHSSDDIDQIFAVEEALIRRCDHLGLSNETDESLGGVNPHKRNHVYVSRRPRRARRRMW